MAKLSNFRTDTAKETEGVWVDYSEGIRFKIARWNNREFRRFLEKLARPNTRAFRKAGGRRGELWDSLIKQAAAKYVLLGWENVDDDGGKPIKYSPDKALEILSDPELSAIWEFVCEAALDEAMYLQEDGEDAEKN